jgi:hypothetical protein
VTATHAIFKGKGRKAPAAVVGVQIDYTHFRNTFMNATSNKKVKLRGTKCICSIIQILGWMLRTVPIP